MKHYTHIVILSQWNPRDIKEYVGCKRYEIKYVPGKEWDIFLILVNRIYTGETLSLKTIYHKQKPIRPKILRAIENYKLKIDIPYQNRVESNFPDNSWVELSKQIFEQKVLTIRSFKRRDELSNYPELITKVTS